MRDIFERIPADAIGVKICGITRAEDANVSIEAGAAALGFNFYPGSKRFLNLETERGWLSQVSAAVLRVAVVVNPTLTEALSLLGEPFLDALQLHGDESVEFCEEVEQQSGKVVIKAIRVQDAASLRALDSFARFPLLLDAFATQHRGGTGQTFDWKLLAEVRRPEKIILSGGLNPYNVLAAVRLTHVRYVDVASGVEENPRRKSAAKIRHFMEEASRASDSPLT